MTAEAALASADRLAGWLGDPDLLLLDCRFDLADVAAGERRWCEAHIPGAVHADLERDLSDMARTSDGRHPLPTAESFSQVLSRWGWHPGARVVAYDDAGGALAAARAWWLLKLAGATRACVLDGGLAAWRAREGALDASVASRAPTAVRVAFDARALVDADALRDLRADGRTVLLDARAPARFRGEVEPIDRVAGHVPGAINRPYSDNLAADGRFKPASTLRAEFEALLGSHVPSQVVHMCGSGVTACHAVLAMDVAGLPGSRVYAPSWSGWISDPSRPVALGER